MIGIRTTAQNITVDGIKKLKSPDEDGIKKEYGDFMEKIENHVTIIWPNWSDIGLVMETGAKLEIDEPRNMGSKDLGTK